MRGPEGLLVRGEEGDPVMRDVAWAWLVAAGIESAEVMEPIEGEHSLCDRVVSCAGDAHAERVVRRIPGFLRPGRLGVVSETAVQLLASEAVVLPRARLLFGGDGKVGNGFQ
jgi:hypothetical protein